MNRKILVTGGNGQLGNEINNLSANFKEWEFLFTDVEDLDITDSLAIDKYVQENKIDTIINCAAYTAVDKAEENEILAEKINAEAVKNLVNSANKYNAEFVHVSTDFIFDGTKSTPYNEDELPNPLNVYGKTKLNGEKEALKVNKGIILRTSWVYSVYGNNFVKSMTKYGKERGELNVIFDQIGTPTYAYDLADAILNILNKGLKTSVEIYNFSNEGVASWYDFAKAVIDISNIDCKINPIETVDYPTPAERPHFSLMNKAKIKKEYDLSIPYWRDSLIKCIDKLNKEELI